MDDKELLSGYIELWKQTVAVQMHFNDIELRIRSLGLTVLTFVLGGAAVAVRDKAAITIFHQHIHLAAVVLLAGLIMWGAFFFMDGVWYHRLLIGAVRHGEAVEQEISAYLPAAGLTKQISVSSPYSISVGLGAVKWRPTIHSSKKLGIYYGTVGSILAGLTLVTWVGVPG